MKKIILLLVLSINIFSQSGINLFPSDLNIQPFTGNFLEPKLGFNFSVGKNDLRLDISNSRDLLHVKFNQDITFSIGADLFTYTKLRGEKDFHFPVDAVDYLFGLNAGYKIKMQDSELGFRFRLSHISAHLVDGHYDPQVNYWRNNHTPRVYSREFVELFPYIKKNSYRIYFGLTHLIHVVPKEIGKQIYQIGGEKFFTGFLFNNLFPFIAYDLKFLKQDKYSGNNTLLAGIKIGKYDGSGISFYYSYFSGYNYHGEYFDFKEKFSSIGVNIDL